MTSGPDDLRRIKSHFAFGDNWADYAQIIDLEAIDAAKKDLLKLIPQEQIADSSFLDIGCGSGLHSLAATLLGARNLLAVDLDPTSVATTEGVLTRYAAHARWRTEEISVFDLSPESHGVFDIVYSWGVLHHTGAMWDALRKAASMVAPNGMLVFALYRSTLLDPFWRLEKRYYSKAGSSVQAAVRACFVAAYAMSFTIARRRSFAAHVANYKTNRGMDFYHDAHDWLGGYPYESALAPDVERHMHDLGFQAARVFARPGGVGIFGSGCDEYVYTRSAGRT